MSLELELRLPVELSFWPLLSGSASAALCAPFLHRPFPSLLTHSQDLSAGTVTIQLLYHRCKSITEYKLSMEKIKVRPCRICTVFSLKHLFMFSYAERHHCFHLSSEPWLWRKLWGQWYHFLTFFLSKPVSCFSVWKCSLILWSTPNSVLFYTWAWLCKHGPFWIATVNMYIHKHTYKHTHYYRSRRLGLWTLCSALP